MYNYAGNNPVKYVDPYGKDYNNFFFFNDPFEIIGNFLCKQREWYNQKLGLLFLHESQTASYEEQIKYLTRQDIEDICSVLSLGLSIVNGVCLITAPEICPYITIGLLAIDGVNLICNLIDVAEQGLTRNTVPNLVSAGTGFSLDLVGMGVSSKIIKGTSPLFHLRYNIGAERFVDGSGKFISNTTGRTLWTLNYLAIPIFINFPKEANGDTVND